MLGNLVGMAIGFTLGVVLRNSAAAIVGYFVVLAGPARHPRPCSPQVRSWFADLQPWIDWNYTQVVLFEGATDTGRGVGDARLDHRRSGSSLPLVVGLLYLRRSEVK